MKYASPKNILFFLIAASVVLLTAEVIRTGYLNSGSSNVIVQAKPQALPDDVERVLEGYRYSEDSDGARISISGRRIIRRGRKILGLRSNLVKTNYFEGIQGTFRTGKGTWGFSAADAEWDAEASHPFILKSNVAVTVNGKQLTHLKCARIFFKQRLMEVEGDTVETYNLN